MKLSILTWNVNFMHDNWLNRVKNINKTLEQHIDNTDIIALQEATLPFSNKISDIYKFLKCKTINYSTGAEFFSERNYLYKKINTLFPRYNKVITSIFEYLMDKLLFICGYIFSEYGEFMKELYFSHPYICIFIALLCPILFLGSWFFIGMITIISKNIKTNIKSKYIGRALQYCEFEFNGREIVFVNIHLTAGKQPKKVEKRKKEINKIYDFIKDKETCILAGDFNESPDGYVYHFLKEKGFVSTCSDKLNNEPFTFPSEKPLKCIDYIWTKGENITIDKISHFGTENETDHKAIKTTLNIKKLKTR